MPKIPQYNCIKFYRTKAKKIAGTEFYEVNRRASNFYRQIKNRTKRRPYVRSVYFKRDKIFLDLFWEHLFDKENWRDRARRLKFFPAAIELIQMTRFEPRTKENPNKPKEILHRFYGITKDNALFCVQIKEDKKTNKKWMLSVFPYE
jgi:hypothetical protein